MEKFTFNIGEQQVSLNEADVSMIFHYMYYKSGVLQQTRWFGKNIAKCPLDLWMYQEIINETRPDIIIETGGDGAFVFFLAQMLDIIGNGKILSIVKDLNEERPAHERIKYIVGLPISAVTEDEAVAIIEEHDAGSVMVILDSEYNAEHVLAEMELWWAYVTIGNYLIVENSNLNGYPIEPDFGAGPMEAIREFISKNNHLAINHNCQKFFMTQNPCGYLQRVR